MKRKVLLIITEDPRKTARPAEAIRMASGVTAWEQVELSVYLHGPAVLALNEEAGDWPDGENFEQWMPGLPPSGCSVFVEDNGTPPANSRRSLFPHQAIQPSKLAEIAALSDCVLLF